jgi:hypothetical protein
LAWEVATGKVRIHEAASECGAAHFMDLDDRSRWLAHGLGLDDGARWPPAAPMLGFSPSS